MFDALAAALAFFYDLWPSYGGAIILLTLAIMLLLTPLSIKSTRSMMAMSRLQPEIKKLQQKHKDDRQKLNEEMLAFYQQNKINPFSSCLPLLLQMPVFIVLYRVIDGLSRVDSNNDDGPKYLDQSSALYQDLKATIPTGTEGSIEMNWLGMDLGHTLTGELTGDGLFSALPFIALVALVAGTGYIQQKQISGRNPNVAVNPQQQMITRLMPGFFALISISIPAGVVLYFVVSNLVRIGQQALVTRLESDNLPPKTTDTTSRVKERDGRDKRDGKDQRDGKNKSIGSGRAKRAPAPPARPARRGNGAGSKETRRPDRQRPAPTGSSSAAPRPRKNRRK